MRLIDADALKKNLAEWLIGGDPQETTMVKLDDIIMNFAREIDEQPTAYDPERVVEELEKEQRKDIEDAKFYRDTKNEKLCIAYTNKARAYKDAIDIVRKEGAL